MKYRKFGKLDWKASALGFGCARLPTIGGEHSNIDTTAATCMLHYAIDHGVNYIDTAYTYHGGNSERLIGEALKGGYREKVKIATKLPSWAVNSSSDFDRYLNEQLRKLQTDYIDFYLLHGLRESRWRNLYHLGVLKWSETAISDGRIDHIGFSFHDRYDVFKEIVDAYNRWAMCQIQYNYMNMEFQAGAKGLEYAESKGLAVAIMEPLLGGRLASPPQPIQAIWDTATKKRSPVDWALHWLWTKPAVSIVLSGMSTMQQVQENVAAASVSGIATLTDQELELFERACEGYASLYSIVCTGCRYCMPCPNEIDIPRNFALFNNGVMYNMLNSARQWYARLPEVARAGHCTGCQRCEELCSQMIPISKWMVRVHDMLGEGNNRDAGFDRLNEHMSYGPSNPVSDLADFSNIVFIPLRSRSGPVMQDPSPYESC